MLKVRAQIIVRDNESNSPEAFARAINRFKKKVAKAGILRLFKNRRHYEKPSETRHKKAQELKRKRKRK